MDWILISIIENIFVAHVQTIWKEDFIPNKQTVRDTKLSNVDEMGA